MYQFLGSDGSVLYVGKAKSLKNRIAQYRQLNQLAAQKRQLVLEAVTVQCQTLESELEALLVEAELIRMYQPRYNILLKDDKSPLYIVVTDEVFPRVLPTRRQNILKGQVTGSIFGPYQSAYTAKQVLRAIRPAFRWCNQAGRLRGEVLNPSGDMDTNIGEAETKLKRRPCFYYHLGLCSGACVGQISPEDYKKNIRRLQQFLRGQSAVVQRSFKQEISELAEQQRFEEAQVRKQELLAIEKLLQPTFHLGPDLAVLSAAQKDWTRALKNLEQWVKRGLPTFPFSSHWRVRRIEGYDVSNFSGKYASVSMVVSTDGVADPNEYRLFNIRTKDTPDDYAMLAEALTRRQNHPEWGIPDLVMIDGGIGQVHAVQKVWKWPVPIIGLAKDPDRVVFVPPVRAKAEEFPAEGDVGVMVVGTKPELEKPEMVPVEELGVVKLVLQSLRDEAHRFAKRQVHRRLKGETLSKMLGK